jgi:hypothetical protein
VLNGSLQLASNSASAALETQPGLFLLDQAMTEERQSRVNYKVDWEAVERDYRTTSLSMRELGRKHDCDNGLICKRAKKQGWTRDLRSAVKQATNAALIEQIVSNGVTEAQHNLSDVVQAAARANAEVIQGHRQDIRGLRNTAARLTYELDTMQPSEGNYGLRVGSVQKLADVFTKLQVLERRAFGLDEESDKPRTESADTLKRLFETMQTNGAGRIQPTPLPNHASTPLLPLRVVGGGE